ncbi:molybdate transport system regulatory protein [Roseimicrobium gellanilyticum]|uniref:Molybdate transport system regulatory protein n=1 Tax=Roseimicrobium gellanilyticum TaxID=748857 RepID=A0A366HUS5_9BACT|nr:winged helix-turn-helix domain-containing protein [Roseimicrobium gellanilyticum]RBP48041.1 molybdate transport system regulatory protein [Roseimicrobium gellanilyticum]
MAAAKKSASVSKKPRLYPRFRMYRGDDLVLGPGKAELLGHIAETGSISEAARRMDMSYNRAWLHVKAMNEGFREPLVSSSRGGSEKGGATLTETGQEVLSLYQKLEAETLAATRTTWDKLRKRLRNAL